MALTSEDLVGQIKRPLKSSLGLQSHIPRTGSVLSLKGSRGLSQMRSTEVVCLPRNL